ncbi:MAG: PAS domain S-box protein [Deltaproteobacteria bacterium]|nr:PAS domain S-box protein [Deltaproteobacteria bacterium]
MSESAVYWWPQLLAGVISTSVAFFMWQRRFAPGAKTLVVLMLATAEWAFLSAFHKLSPDLSTKILLAKIQYIGIVTVPPALFTFALQYTGREKWLTKRNLILLGILPMLTLALVWTNSVHHLFWKSVLLETDGSVPIGVYQYGPFFWVWIAFGYLLSLLSTIWLIETLLRSPHVYRMQILIVLIGISAPWLANGLYIFKLIPAPYIDLTPMAFTFSGLTLGWGLFRFGILDIMPVAKETVLENIPDPVIVLNFRNRIVNLNPAAQKIISVTDSDAIGKSVLKVLGDQPVLTECLKGKTESSSEIVLGNGDMQRYYDLNLLSLKDGRNRSIGRLIILRDFTDQKKTEKALRESEKKYRLLVDNTDDAIFVAQGDFITFANPKTEEITGYSAEELTRIPFANLIDPEDRETVLDRHIRGLNGEEVPRSYSFRVINKTGQQLWVQINAVIIINWEGEPATLNSLRDITEQRKLEEQLIRTERLAATGQLAASVAHQINSPLQGIASLLSVMKKSGKPDDGLSENITLLEGAFKSIRETVRALLDLNRPGRALKQTIDINKIIQDTVALLRSFLKDGKITVNLSLSSEPLLVIASPQQLSQVFMNLMVNAAEAIRDHKEPTVGGEIDIKTGQKEDRFVIEVSDSGPGISEKALRHIFSPFYTEKKKMGLGIGLSICHKIIEDHGGTLAATNSPDSGAIFIITLPVDRSYD